MMGPISQLKQSVLSTINFLKKISPLKLAGPAKLFLNGRAELRLVALFIVCR
jgi:hypothetical protein